MDIKKTLELHQLWLDDIDGGERADLSDSDLSNSNLRGANLRGANLWGANLRGANLSDSNLSGANLRGANLWGANLRGANLWGANLRGANLSDSDLSGANLRGANLWGANLRGANLWGADLWGVVGNRGIIRSIQLEEYDIAYTSEILQIGCKRYTFDQWKNFTDEEIVGMDGKTALKWWRKWKDWLFMTIEMAPADKP